MSSEERADYCVYMHVDKQGIPFYVGSGTKRRALLKEKSKVKGRGTCRGLNYSNKVEALNFDYDVVIVEENLTKQQCLELETKAYNTNSLTLVNHREPNKEIKLDKLFLSKYVAYDESSYTCLRWVVDRSVRGAVSVKAGDVAGTIRNNKWYNVKINGVSYCVHRVIAVLHDLNVSGLVVDHIDGNGLNNRIENLRIVTQAVNSRNRITTNNKSGVVGVILQKSRNNESEKWRAYWQDESITKSKAFAISIHGYEEAFRLACEARENAIRELNERGAGYTERHCT